MSTTRGIVGYIFKVVVEKRDGFFSATCPGVGGVHEEADTLEEVMQQAVEAAFAIFRAREKTGAILTKDNPHLKVLRQPKKKSRAIPFPTESSTHCGVYMLPAQA